MKQKTIVGWHCTKNDIRCDFCGKRGSDVIVEVTDDETPWYGPNTCESCADCTPTGSCEDKIANTFAKAC